MDPLFERDALITLSRKDLQALAKQCSVKANQKTSVIIEQLEEYYDKHWGAEARKDSPKKKKPKETEKSPKKPATRKPALEEEPSPPKKGNKRKEMDENADPNNSPPKKKRAVETSTPQSKIPQETKSVSFTPSKTPGRPPLVHSAAKAHIPRPVAPQQQTLRQPQFSQTTFPSQQTPTQPQPQHQTTHPTKSTQPALKPQPAQAIPEQPPQQKQPKMDLARTNLPQKSHKIYKFFVNPLCYYKVLTQISQTNGASTFTMRHVDGLIKSCAESLSERAGKFTVDILTKNIKTSITGKLQICALKEVERALRYVSATTNDGNPLSSLFVGEICGTTFDCNDISTILGDYEINAAACLTAVLEYICAELFDVASKTKNDKKSEKNLISIKDIVAGIQSDPEMAALFSVKLPMLKSLVSDGIQGSSDSPIENAIEKQFGTKVPATLIHLWTLASSAEKKAVDSWEKISLTISNDKHSMMVFGLLGWFPIKFLGKKTEDQMDVDEEDEVKEWICLDLENNYVVKISLKNGTPTKADVVADALQDFVKNFQRGEQPTISLETIDPAAKKCLSLFKS